MKESWKWRSGRERERDVGHLFSGRAGKTEIRRFDVEWRLVADEICIGETDLLNQEDAVAIGVDGLDQMLQRYESTIDQLDLPFKSDYPI